MANKLVNVRLSKKLYSECTDVVKEFGFNNIQELVKEALRNAVHEYHKRKGIEWLEKNFGKSKPRKRLTKTEKEKIALGLTQEESKRLSKEFFDD